MKKSVSQVCGNTVQFSGKHLVFRDLVYRDESGAERHWECVDRVMPASARLEKSCAVFIVARIMPQDEILLVRQFRPPVNSLVLEFPAGLVDPGEDAATTAVRELYEETGYRGEVSQLYPAGFSSPGLSGESIRMVGMRIDGELYPEPPANHPDDGEFITVFRVKRSDLAGFIRSQLDEGVKIDTKILMMILNFD